MWRAKRRLNKQQGAAVDEQSVWSQLESQTKQQQHHHSRALTALLELQRRQLTFVSNALQHKCDVYCEWIDDVSPPDWFICKTSGNVHICTPKECKYRSREQGIRLPVLQLNKEDKTQESSIWLREPERDTVCTLTGRVREMVEFAREKDQPQSAGKTHEKRKQEAKVDKLDKYDGEAQQLAEKFYGKEVATARVRKIVSTICLRLWTMLPTEPRCCKFDELCRVVLKDLYTGWSVRASNGEMLAIIPQFIPEGAPDITRLDDGRFRWNITHVKSLHTNLTSVGEEALRNWSKNELLRVLSER